MYNVFDYAAEYGDKTFAEMPFNDVDAVALINDMYMWVQLVVPREFQAPEDAMTLRESNDLLMEKFHGEYVGFGLAMNKEVPIGYDKLAKTARYGDIKITGVRNEYDMDEHLQYCAITLHLDDERMMVVYRGTDDSIAGWIEDADILVKGEIPSHKLSVDYITEAAAAYPGKKIIVGGHSKGGHVALYAALNCSDEIRKRFELVYNNDGPGFANYDLFKTQAYQDILPVYRHIIPFNSFVGMMLCHDDDYLIVNSSAPIGMAQHSSESWQFKGPELDLMDDLGTEGKINKKSFEQLGENIDVDNLNAVYGILVAMTEGMAQPGLIGVVKNLPSSVSEAIKAYRAASPEDKAGFKRGVSKFGKIVVSSAREIIRQNRKSAKDEKTVKDGQDGNGE